MASTYSPLLRFELIASGEQAGLWGNTANYQLGTLLEQAIAGVTSITLTSTANYTLSSVNGTVDEARSATLVFSGSPGGAVNIIVPSSQKQYVIKNGTNQTLTIKTGSQVGGVTLTTGNTISVFCDGTDVYPSITPGVIGAPTTSGTGATGTWNINISGNASTATNAVNAANATTVTNGVYTTDTTTGASSVAALANKLPKYTASGFLAFGSSPFSWGGSGSFLNPTFGMDFGSSGAFWATGIDTSTGYLHGPGVAANCYYDGSIWRGKAPGQAALYWFQAGRFLYQTASVTGAAGSAVATFTTKVSFDVGGTVMATQYTTNSDRRLKTNIKPVTGALTKVKKIKGVTYERLDVLGETTRYIGVLAQDVAKVCPEAVSTGEDGYMRVAYGNLVGLLVEAIKELEAKVRALETAQKA